MIKNLSIQETIMAELEQRKISRTRDPANQKLGRYLSFLETYVLENSIYTPLLRADTSFTSEKDINNNAD